MKNNCKTIRKIINAMKWAFIFSCFIFTCWVHAALMHRAWTLPKAWGEEIVLPYANIVALRCGATVNHEITCLATYDIPNEGYQVFEFTFNDGRLLTVRKVDKK